MSPEPRRDFAVPVPVRVIRAAHEPRDEYAVNLSPGGMCLHVREPLGEGERVEVSFSLPPDGLVVEARGHVVWSSRHAASAEAPRFWEVGLRLDAMEEQVRAQVASWAGQPIDRRR